MRECLNAVARSTTVLPGMGQAIERMAADTSALAEIRRVMTKVADATRPLPEVAEATSVLPGMDQRMAVIESAMPTFVEVQEHLAELPETIREMTSVLKSLHALVAHLDQRDDDVLTLYDAIEPLGSLANRVPGTKRK